jgi:hypothetical protein
MADGRLRVTADGRQADGRRLLTAWQAADGRQAGKQAAGAADGRWAETADGDLRRQIQTAGRGGGGMADLLRWQMAGDIHPGIPQDRLYNLTIKIDNTLHLIKVLQYSKRTGQPLVKLQWLP